MLGEDPLGRPHQPDGLLSALPGVGLLVLVLVAVGGASTVLTCIWNFQASSYFTTMAYDPNNHISYNLIPDAVPGVKGGLLWTLSSAAPAPGFAPAVINIKVYLDIVVYFCALGGTVLVGLFALRVPRLRRLLHARLGALLLPRGFLASHLEACAEADDAHAAEERECDEADADEEESRKRGGCCAAAARCCGRRARTTVTRALGLPPTLTAGVRRVLSLPREALATVRDFSLGESVIILEVAALYAFWCWYWTSGNPRIHLEVDSMGDRHRLMHIWARVLGHVLTLTMSFLAFPVTRSSVWEAAFGVPFERAVAYHRALGKLTWLLVTAHMLLWQAKWLLEGTFLKSAFNPAGLEVTRCEDGLGVVIGGQVIVPAGLPCVWFGTTDDPDDPPLVSSALHEDNFTIVIAEAAWLLLTAVLAVAICCRRSNYKLFHITHHAVLLFFMAGIVHAWSHWYYTAAGLILYTFDKLTRAAKASRQAEVVSLSHAAGITRLQVSARALGAGGFYAGQYAFVCVPAVAPFEWHPFTISSCPEEACCEPGDGSEAGRLPGAGTVTFHIKDMGPGTWTRRLALLAQRAAARAAGGKGGDLDGEMVR